MEESIEERIENCLRTFAMVVLFHAPIIQESDVAECLGVIMGIIKQEA